VTFASNYKICNLLQDKYYNQHVVVTTLGNLLNKTKGRDKMDLSELRVFVLDEADSFFLDKVREDELIAVHQLL
jgi:superfamily II DNA/RNA helicase